MKLNFSSWIILFGMAVGISSCQDDELFHTFADYDSVPMTRNLDGSSSGLMLQDDGYWKATRRVPLVGMGRIVDNLSGALISVGPMGNDAPNLVDTDLTNTFAVSGVIDANVATNQIVSIRDLNHVYAGGQKAGFVCKNLTNGILELSVLKSFWIDTYLKGKLQDQHVFTNATSVLDLGLGNISGGGENQTFLVEAEFSKPFDEVRIGINGINATIAQGLSIYYAYVGENPMIPAVNNGPDSYFGNNVTSPYEGSYLDISRNKLIDDDLGNGIEISVISALFQPHMSVNFGKDMPAGTEVGFYVTSAKLLELGVGQTILIRTFDENDNEVDKYSYTKVVALGLLGGGKYIYSLTTTKPCRRVRIDFVGLNVKLGVSVVHYAFVREKTVVDPSSYFTIANATVYNPNYRFAEPETGSIKYELISGPNRNTAKIEKEEVGDSFLLTGMNITGNYKVKAIYTDEQGNVYEQTAVITRLKKKQTACDVHLVNTEDFPNRYKAYVPDGFGGIEIGGGSVEESLNNVVDENTNNFLQYTNANLAIASNKALVGVKITDGTVVNSSKKNIRVGFVINKSLDILGLNALQFLRIKLYRNGTEVATGVAKENNGISINIGGVSKEQARLSIDTDSEFDQIELFSTGLLTVQLGEELKIYHAFWETTVDCGDPGEECMQLISNANYGALVTLDTKGLADIGGTTADLGNMVDGDIESYATVVKPVTAGTDTEIKVTFNTIKANQETGFILTGVTGLTNVDLIGIMQIKAYKDGKDITDNTTEGGLLGLKLAGSGQRRYISITPTSDFNELRLIIGKGLGALSNYLINGVYLRPDYDNDGIMDCIRDELSSEIINLYVEPEDICIGNRAAFRVDGGEEGVTYQLKFEDKNNQSKSYQADVTINASGYLDFTDVNFFSNLPVGEYYVSVLQGEYSLNKIGNLTIHPLETTWKGEQGTEWNNWNNWDRGTPWQCTNVILPSSLNTYPELTANPNKAYYCNSIHFEPGAELVGQVHLNYVNAFIDTKLTGGNYQLLSSPLKSMVTGDMFVQEESRRTAWENWRNKVEQDLHINYFTKIIGGNDEEKEDIYKESRVNPIIYQRFFSKTVTNAVLTRTANTDDPAIRQTDWSRSFNAVSTSYEIGQGFAVKIGEKKEALAEFNFHFPKSHETYRYYDISGKPTGKSESIKRTDVGKLMVDNQISMPRNIVLERQNEGTEFLFGNPFMAHINISSFLKVNSKVISSIQIYKDGNYVTISEDGTASQADAPILIRPMEAVFVIAKDKSVGITVTISESMLQQGKQTTRTRRSSPSFPKLYLTACANNHTASCVALQSTSAYDGYQSGEDIPLLIESEVKPEVAVFTMVDDKALSIQRMCSSKRIPIGFFMKNTGYVRLSFQAQGTVWEGWKLVDLHTGRRYSLTESIMLENVATGSKRFYLEKEA